MDYRHEKHAGNHGDIFKHSLLITLLKQAVESFPDGDVVVMDTHAGIGFYENGNQREEVTKTLTAEDNVPKAIEDFIQLVQQFPSGYPGSPAFANMVLRSLDEQHLWELNTAEFERLQSCKWKTRKDTVTQLNCADGFEQVPECVSRSCKNKKHAVVLIDPPYENYEQECYNLQQTVRTILTKDPTATLMIWIPLLQTQDASFIESELKKIAANREWICGSLTVSKKGLQGSSVLIINPISFDSMHLALQSTLPWLASNLKQECMDHSITTSQRNQ